MKLKNFLIVVSAITLLGNGCANSPSPVPVNEKLPQESSFEEGSNKLNFYQESYSKEDRAKWRSLGWPEACEQEFQEFGMTDDGGLRVYPLGNEQYILSITCNTYVYQSSLVFMLLQTNSHLGSVTSTEQTLDFYNIATKKLEPIRDEETGAPVVLGFDFFDSKNKTLSIYTKHRGLGDCGTNGTYMIINNKITLIKYEAQSCENADEFYLKTPTAESIPAWPVIYEKK